MRKFFKENKVLLISLFCFSILVYGYFGVSGIFNIDGINDLIVQNKIYDYRLYISVGRWGWAILGALFKYYPMPFLCLFINAFFFSITGVYASKLFKVENKILSFLIGAIIIAFPYNMNAYSYSAWQVSLGFSIFLCFITIYNVKTNKSKYSILLSVLLIGFIIGIYQMFLSFLAVLFVIISIQEIFENKKVKDAWKKIFKYLAILVLGCLYYFLMVKLTVFAFNVEMSSYQNANHMFSLKITEIVKNMLPFFKSLFKIESSEFFPAWIQLSLLLFVTIGMIYSLIKEKNVYKRMSILFLYMVLFISPKVLMLFKPDQLYHAITKISYIPFFTFGIVNLYNCIKDREVLTKSLVSVLCLISFIFLINANEAGVMAKNSSQAAFMYLNRIQSRVEEIDEYSALKEKKYIFFSIANFSTIPYSEKAYFNEVGITSTLLTCQEDAIDALNVMGVKAIDGMKTISEKDYIQIYVKYLEARGKQKLYPNKESVYIYNGYIVVNLY